MKKVEQRRALLYEMADALLQSWWTVVAGVCFGLAGAVVALSMVQAWYQATALLYVTPELARELSRNTVSEDMTRRMMALQEAVLSEEYMRQMVETTYGEQKDEERMQRRMRSVRNRVVVEPAAVGNTAEALFAFNLTYIDTRPDRAALGANTLAELYIEQNKNFRLRQAQEAANAADDQAAGARAEFEEADRALIEFREEHRFETDDHQDANLRLLERRQSDLDNNTRDQRAAENQKADLETRLSEVEAGSVATAEQVAELRRRLDDLLVQYSEAHPEVIRVQRRLNDLLGELGLDEDSVKPGQTEPSQYPPDPQVTALREQIASTKRDLVELKKRESRLRGEIAEYERRINAVPRVQPQLSRLLTEHSMMRDRYEALQVKADTTREALFLERTLRGERFELSRRAEVPRRPFFPQPIRFYALGVIAGCLLFVGPLLARRLLNPRISSESGLRSLTAVPVLVTLPRIVTASTRGYAVRRLVKNLALSLFFAAVTVGAFFFMS